MQCLSAFIKSIRRGLEKDSLYWGLELANSGYSELLWRRIKIHTSEDIGTASQICPIIRALYQNWIEENDKKTALLFIVHAILLMSRSQKSREVDDALTVTIEDTGIKDIPDYSIDWHSEIGRNSGRLAQHWIDEASLLANESGNIYKDQAAKIITNR